MNKPVMFFAAFFLLLPGNVLTVEAQVVEEWAARFPNASGRALAVDGNGNVYVTSGSVSSARSGATIKYDAAGNQQWVASDGAGRSIALDSDANVYVAYFTGGAGFVTVKYDTNGNKLWQSVYRGPGAYDEVSALAIDLNGNIYVTGFSLHGGFIGHTGDYATVKYDTNGNQVWVARFNGPLDGTDFPSSVAVDDAGHAYVTGWSGLANRSDVNDYLTIKYDENGDEKWIARYNGPANDFDEAKTVKVDIAGNVFVTGASKNPDGIVIATVKYDANGNELWVARYGEATTNEPTDLEIDNAGNTYVTGKSGFGTSNFFYVTIKYDFSGTQVWAAIHAQAAFASSEAISVDSIGNVYVTGSNYETVKYDANGIQEWIAIFAGSASSANDIAIDASGHVYVTGGSLGASAHDIVTIKYSQIFVENQPPVANAGPDQSVHQGSLVTLDGSGSSDPDENYPLTYAWEITSKPAESAADLSDPSTVNPSFTADKLGDYLIELVVTDDLGASSAADEVMVSTFNTAPVAEAGPHQEVTTLGTVVELDGTQSYDPDGDPFTYAWVMTSRPEGSGADLSHSDSATPTFVADRYGAYEISLVTTDIFGAASTPDTVLVSFMNLQPVANAGLNQSVLAGDTVLLDGSASSDPNSDPLTYSWSIVTAPAGSAAAISNPTSVQPSFVADLPGTYVVSLVVHDGLLNSSPSNVTIEAISVQNAITQTLQELITSINGLDGGLFKNVNMKNALTNKINVALQMVDQGKYSQALDKLQNDILPKTDGCAATGVPDANDWITTCGAQSQVYPLILQAIDLLSRLV